MYLPEGAATFPMFPRLQKRDALVLKPNILPERG